jgi:hypothetical protein
MEFLDLVGVFGVPGISTVEEAPTGALQTTVQTAVTGVCCAHNVHENTGMTAMG